MNLEQIEQDIWDKSCLTRVHILDFLRLQNTSDAMVLRQRTEDWLAKLHADPKLSKISFNPEAPNASLGVSTNPAHRILDDLDSYGLVTQETILGAPPRD